MMETSPIPQPISCYFRRTETFAIFLLYLSCIIGTALKSKFRLIIRYLRPVIVMNVPKNRSHDISAIKFNLSHHSDLLNTSTAPVCTGLKTDWTSTIKTTTQFPVNPGTVVEVTCSDTDAVNEGSNQVTCTAGTDFTFSKEPSCSIPGKFM